jgi:predicted ATPase/tetratricopeptide (TPR) repeat protein
VVRALAQQQCLVVLDNCEHVLDAAATLAAVVGERCRAVTVLATSREGLGVPGEQLVAVRPLDTADAVRLFRVRASEIHGGFEPAEADEALISELCERLDGLPLAIELAAARARSMTLADLTGRLGERFRLLRGQRRGADRHQTLRATVAWSYGLLADEERRLFDRLSVFTGGFTLAAAEAVCADAELDVVTVDELVVALADKSMIVAELQGSYRLLETLRQFGEEQLHATGDPDRFRAAHLEYFTAFAVACHDGLQSRDQTAWLGRMHADWANLRAAFGWAKATADVTAAATIAVRLIWAAAFHDVSEPYSWIGDVAAMASADNGPHRHHILAGNAWAAWEYGRLDDAVELGLKAIAAEPEGQANIDYLAELAILSAAFYMPNLALAEAYLDRIVERAHADGRVVHEAMYTSVCAIFRWAHQQYDKALVIARHALELAERSGNPNVIAWALAQEGDALSALGDPAGVDVLESGLAFAQRTGSIFAATVCRRSLGRELLNTRRTNDAIELLLQDVQIIRRRAAWMVLRQSLVHVADALARMGASEPAATLYGATHNSSTATAPHTAVRMDALHRRLADALDERTLNRLIAAGEQLDPEQAAVIAEAALVALLQPPGPSTDDPMEPTASSASPLADPAG